MWGKFVLIFWVLWIPLLGPYAFAETVPLAQTLAAARAVQEAGLARTKETYETAKKNAEADPKNPDLQENLTEAKEAFDNQSNNTKNLQGAVEAAESNAKNGGTSDPTFKSARGKGEYSVIDTNGEQPDGLKAVFTDAHTGEKFGIDLDKVDAYERSFNNGTAGTSDVMKDSGIVSKSSDGGWHNYRDSVGDTTNSADGDGVQHIFGSYDGKSGGASFHVWDNGEKIDGPTPFPSDATEGEGPNMSSLAASQEDLNRPKLSPFLWWNQQPATKPNSPVLDPTVTPRSTSPTAAAQVLSYLY